MASVYSFTKHNGSYFYCFYLIVRDCTVLVAKSQAIENYWSALLRSQDLRPRNSLCQILDMTLLLSLLKPTTIQYDLFRNFCAKFRK